MSYKELLAALCAHETAQLPPGPGNNKSDGRGGPAGVPAALCPGAGFKVDGSAKSISLLVSGEKIGFLGST